MAIFSSGDRGADRPVRSRANRHDTALSIVGRGVRITGELETDGIIKIEGRVEGSVRAAGQVLVAKGGVVEGDIFTREAVIGGEVRGGIFADERLEVEATSVISGDITTPRILVRAGGQVNGFIRMEHPNVLRKEPEPRTTREGKKQETDPSEASRSSGEHTEVGEASKGVAVMHQKSASAKASAAGLIGLIVVTSGCGLKQSALDDQLAQIRDEVQAGDRALSGRIDQVDQRVTRLAVQAGRVEELQQELEALRSDFDARIEHLQAAIRFDTPVHFAFDSDEIRTEDMPLLDRFASVVLAYYPVATVTVEGFTDPAGSPEYNLYLGQQRANAVRAYLTDAGGLDREQVRAVTYGEVQNRQITPGAWGKQGLSNRRVALVIDYSGEGVPLIAGNNEQ